MSLDNPSDSDTSSETIPYFKRPEWNDVKPLLQTTPGDPPSLSPITYDEEQLEAISYFRAISVSREKSKRALEITQVIIEIDPVDYEAWQVRKEIILSQVPRINLKEELEFLKNLVQALPKNYQIWNHRREIVEAFGLGYLEKEFCEVALKIDAKNYQAWSHRKWAVERWGLWDGEIAFVESTLLEDPRNNSAWAHRVFTVLGNPKNHIGEENSNLVIEGFDLKTEIKPEIISQEIEFAVKAIQTLARNEAAWNHLIFWATKSKNEEELRILLELLRGISPSDGGKVSNRFPGTSIVRISMQSGIFMKLLQDNEFEDLCTLLATIDSIRASYWNQLKTVFRKKD